MKSDGFDRADLDADALRRAADILRDDDGPEPAQNERAWCGTIGSYRLLRRIGEGGMGVVYEAEQQHPKRAVAVKVVRGGQYVDEARVKLFTREAQTLARLRHPGIAAIYEAGRTDDGQHFFAMELVPGVPLMDYVRGQKPAGSVPPAGRRDRLDLFRRICDAIHYAHQRGVIHRDLKPSNILVVDDAPSDGSGTGSAIGPQIKILDFGLARITDGDVMVTTIMTEVGRIAGTLAYMSPEQAQGNPDEIDVRSDVYALGVILYELLTDRRPYDIDRAQIHEALRIICHQPPRRPSSVTGGVRGDLETILLKALEKDPSRRYQSAFGLSEDVARFMNNQPILARPPSAAYQFRKLVARHRVPSAFAALLLLTISVFVAATAIQAARVREQRDRATREADRAQKEARKAERISAFLREMLASVSPDNKGQDVTVREVLDEAAERIDTDLSGEPEAEAAIRTTIGNSYRSLGLYELADAHLSKALQIQRQNSHGDDAAMAETLNALAGVLWLRGRRAEATPLLREALDINLRLHGEQHPAVERCRCNLAILYGTEGEYDKAGPLLREILTAKRAQFGDVHLSVASAASNLAALLRAKGDHAAAEALFREAVDIMRELYEPGHIQIASAVTNLGVGLRQRGALSEAEPLIREGLAIREKQLPDKHPQLLESRLALAALLRAQAKYAEAEPLLEDVLAARRERLGHDHPQVAEALHELGMIRYRMGRYDSAASMFRESLDIRQKRFGPEHSATQESVSGLGLALASLGEYDAAEQLLRQALDVARSLLGEDHAEVANHADGLGTILLAQEELDEAESLHRLALRIYGKLPDIENTTMARVQGNLAAVLHAKGQIAESFKLYEDTLATYLANYPDGHPYIATVINNIGLLMRDTGRLDEAAAHFRQSLDMRIDYLGEHHPDTMLTMDRLAAAYADNGEPERAEPLYRRLVDLLQHHTPDDELRIAGAQGRLGECLTRAGHFDQAQPLLIQSHARIHAEYGDDHAETRAAAARLDALAEARRRQADR